jgi:hypothetical protein
MKAHSILFRTFLATLALTAGIATTAPAWADSKGGHEAKICLKLLKPHCIRL